MSYIKIQLQVRNSQEVIKKEIPLKLKENGIEATAVIKVVEE